MIWAPIPPVKVTTVGRFLLAESCRINFRKFINCYADYMDGRLFLAAIPVLKKKFLTPASMLGSKEPGCSNLTGKLPPIRIPF